MLKAGGLLGIVHFALRTMFDPNTEAQDLNSLQTKQDSTSALCIGEGAYGLTNKQFDQPQSGSSLNSGLDIDPWTNEAGANAANPQLFANNSLTGEEAGAQGGFNQAAGEMEFGASNAETNEVFNLLRKDIYNRDEITGTNHHRNNEWVSRFDRGDARHNAHNVGTVVYREDAQINGNIGKTIAGVRDKNDWYKFRVGKTGTIELDMTGLSGNVGLALYNKQGQLLDWSDKGGTANESISKHLTKGDYFARVYSYKQNPWNHQQSNYSLNIERKADALESFWKQKISDSSIENAALNSIKYESHLSRNDVIGILSSVRDYDQNGQIGNVNQQEINDLRGFYNYAINTTHVRNDVKVLSKKVIFSDPSNTWYTGSDSVKNHLGNIQSGWSATNTSLLIGKHFLGTDRPMIHSNANGTVAGTYTKAGGSLFVNGISANDIDQGASGTCYFLSSLAGTANDKSHMIRNMFRNNGDGTYTVRFHTNNKLDYVTVDKMMATSASGRYIYADQGDGTATNGLVAGNNELWVALAEKAYAQVNESGRLGQQESTNRYGIAGNEGISWGFMKNAIRHITGLSASSGNLNASGINGVSSAELQGLVNSNKVVTVGWGGHARSIVGYNAVTGRYNIRNPYDRNHSSLTHAQLCNNGASVAWSNS
jgi:hypothetical protein